MVVLLDLVLDKKPRSSKPRMLALLPILAFLSQINNAFIKLT